jgi:hypothetical protein
VFSTKENTDAIPWFGLEQVRVYVCVYRGESLFMCVRTYVRVCMCMCVYTYICIHAYIVHIFTRRTKIMNTFLL